MNQEIKGYSEINQFRDNNGYETTQKLFEKLGLTKEVEDNTPTVGVNVAHLATMITVQKNLKEKIEGQNINIAILGLTTADGPKDLQILLKALNTSFVNTTVVDLANGIFGKVKKTGLDQVTCLQQDARNTDIPSNSQDIVLLDHLGNCCPPNIDRQINLETKRILKPNATAIINITTSELLLHSPDRSIWKLDELKNKLHLDTRPFIDNIYDLQDLNAIQPEKTEIFRGPLLEIEPESFVIFGEDEQGHGEWFRNLKDHLTMWETNGFKIQEIKSRVGWDSHLPPLRCFRHNVVLENQ